MDDGGVMPVKTFRAENGCIVREQSEVELDYVDADVEIGDRVRSAVGTEKARIRPAAAGQRVAVSADENISTVAADQYVVPG